MREKFRNKKGFTLAELLIVVAIIAVLVAIMIPVFGASRDKAILEKDTANLRSIYAEAVTKAMADDSYSGGTLEINFQKAISESGVKFTSGTTAKYTPATTENGKIEVTRSGKTETIVIDADVKLTGNNAWSTTSATDLTSLLTP